MRALTPRASADVTEQAPNLVLNKRLGLLGRKEKEVSVQSSCGQPVSEISSGGFHSITFQPEAHISGEVMCILRVPAHGLISHL